MITLRLRPEIRDAAEFASRATRSILGSGCTLLQPCSMCPPSSTSWV